MTARGSPLLALAVVALVSAWGTQFLVIQIGQRDIPPLLGAALRFSILLLVAQMLVALSGARALESRVGERLVASVAHALSMAMLYWSDGKMPSSLAGVLFTTMPIFVALMAHYWVPGEHLRGRALLGACMGLAGVTLLAGGRDDGQHPLHAGAIAVGIGAAVCAARNRVTAKRLIDSIPAWVLLRDAAAMAACVAGIGTVLFEHERAAEFSAEAIGAVVYLGLVPSAAASALYLLLLRKQRVVALSYIQFGNALVAL